MVIHPVPLGTTRNTSQSGTALHTRMLSGIVDAGGSRARKSDPASWVGY